MTTTTLRSSNASLHRTPTGCGWILAFSGLWIALEGEQLRGLARALRPLADGTACAHCQEHGLTLHTATGDRQLPVSNVQALELLGLCNDALLLHDAEAIVRRVY
jgi:hypothetical protein